MNQYWFSKELFDRYRLAIALAIGWLCLIGVSPVSGQSGALTPNHGQHNEFRPIPKAERPTEFGQQPIRKQKKVPFNQLIQQVSYEQQQPAVDPLTSANLPWTYKLEHLDYGQFEQKLADIWGARLEGEVLDDQRRTLRVYFPEGSFAPEASMKFDRVSGIATYEGTATRKQGWHQLMRAIDQTSSTRTDRTTSVIDIGLLNEGHVRLVSAQFPTQQDVQRSDTQDSIELSGRQLDQLQQSGEFQRLRGQLQGKIFLDVNEETNTLFITGAPEDVAIIRGFLDRLNQQAVEGGADIQAFPLPNTDPNQILDSVLSLYQSRFQNFHGDVEVVPTETGLLAAGSPEALAVLEKIIDGFKFSPEQVKPENDPLTAVEKGYQQFYLSHIDVSEAKRQVDALFGRTQNAGGANQARPSQPVETQVNHKTNTLIVYAGPQFLRRAAELIKEIDVPASASRARRQVKIIPIRNHVAGDLAFLLQDLVTQGLQANNGPNVTSSTPAVTNTARNEQFATTRQSNQPFSALALLQLVVDGKELPPADLFDTRITSDPISNTIQVTATAEALPIIEELVSMLDRLPNLTSELKIFPVVNSDATQLLATMQQIFGADQAAAGAAAGGQGTLGSGLPLQSPGTDGASLINIRFAIHEGTNTIIASGSAGDLELVEGLIIRLDEPDVNDRETKIYRLYFASVLEVAAAIDGTLQGKSAFFNDNPLTNAPVELAQRNVIVVEEEISNTLIVNARPEAFPEIDFIIEKLDRRPNQVKVKASIVQVDLNQLENFGVEFGLQDSAIFGAGLSDAIGTGFVGLDSPSAQLLSSLGVGRASSAAGGLPGFLLTAGDDSLNFVLRFLKQKGCASVLFNPQVLTLEGLQGQFVQGASIQRANGSTTTGVGNVVQQFDEVDIGLNLAITPRVTPDGMIIMFVDIVNSSLGPESAGTTVGFDATTGAAIVSAPINETSVQTTMMARSGQTVVLSGLIQEAKGQTINSIPILGDLPVIGPVFQSVENTADRTEILIFLTPYLVDGDDDLSALNQDDFDRMHWCLEDIAEAYGNTSYTGGPYSEAYPAVYRPAQDPQGKSPLNSVDELLEPNPIGSDNRNPLPTPQPTGSSNRNELLDDQGWQQRNERNGGSSTRSNLPERHDQFSNRRKSRQFESNQSSSLESFQETSHQQFNDYDIESRLNSGRYENQRANHHQSSFRQRPSEYGQAANVRQFNNVNQTGIRPDDRRVRRFSQAHSEKRFRVH